MENLPATTVPAGLRPFEKGKSGNPTGRPKGSVGFRKRFRDMTPMCERELRAIIVGKRQDPHAPLHKKTGRPLRKMIYREETAMRLKAIELVLERGWGKASNFIGGDDAENAEGNPQLDVPQQMLIRRVFVNMPSEVHHHHSGPDVDGSAR